MGGSGGLFSGGYDPNKYKEIIEKAREQTRDKQYESDVNAMINNLLGEYERDANATREHLEEIKKNIEEKTIGTMDTRFGGSVKRHTYVDGLSDVDVLLVIDKTDLIDQSPQEILQFIKSRLDSAKLKEIKDISIGTLAVTVSFLDGEEIQLLPAVRKGDGYKIPNQVGTNWSNIIRPDKFAERLTDVNQSCNGKVVPVVKLAKGIIAELPEDQQLTGYHIESVAIEVFKSYPDSNPRTAKAMLRHFFENARNVVKNPIEDKTGQSLHVDDYLGSANSQRRLRIGYALDKIGRKMREADDLNSIDKWKSILGE